MLNIVIKNNNQFFNLGFHFYCKRLSRNTHSVHRSLHRLTKSSCVMQTSSYWDLCRGEEFVCHPELLNRKPGLLIGVAARLNYRGRGALPLCLKEIVFAGRDEKLFRLLRKIKLSWVLTPPSAKEKLALRCDSCPQRTLSAAENHRGGNLSGVNGEHDCQKAIALQ